MSLTLVFGEAGTGKSEYCTNQMIALKQKGVSSIIIVPEQFAHSAETRLMEKAGFLSDQMQAVSFKRLAQKYLQKSGLLQKNISRVGKSMLLSKAILTCERELTIYKGAAKRPGFSDALLTFISECKRSSVTPVELNKQSNVKDPLLAMKLGELSLIYSTYQKFLDAGYTDTEDFLSLFTAYMEKHNFFQNTVIFIDEFFRFTQAELACIRNFLVSGAQVYVTLAAPDSRADGFFAPVTKTGQALTLLAKEAGVAVNEPIILKEKFRFAASPELSHFESEYHTFPPRVYSAPTENVSLYIAPDIYTEVQALAVSIKNSVRTRGLHYRDIAVLVGNPDMYQSIIKTVFPIYNIPVFIDQKRSLLNHPIIVMLFSLLELLSKGLETDTLLAYLKTGYAGLSQEETDRLENFALAASLSRQDWLDDQRFLKRADSVFYQTEDVSKTNAEESEQLIEYRNRVFAPLLTLRESLTADRSVRSRAAALFTFFEEIGLYDKVQNEMEKMLLQKEHQAAREHSEIYNLLISLLDELVTCFGDEKIGLRRLSLILSAGLSQCEISTIPPTLDHVFLGDGSRSLVKNVKALFVIGANDNTFPSPPPKEGLLKDSEREILSETGLDLGPDNKKIAFHNQYLVYSSLNISSGSLAVSYPVADFEGKGLRPSPLVRRLRKLFSNLTVTDDLLSSPPPERLIAGKASAWQYVLEHFSDKSAEVTALKDCIRHDPAYMERYEAAKRHQQYTNEAKDLSPALAKQLYGQELWGSISQFERYRSCPFSYFLQYGLRAKERKILKIDAPDLGSLLHQIVEIASRRIQEDGKQFGALSKDYISQLAESVIDELFTDLFITKLYSEARLSALIRRLKGQVIRMLTMISTHVARGEFEPCAFEVAFGKNGELPPVKVNLPTGETITLMGRIDRIDVLKKDASLYIKIIDYKSGNKSFKLNEIYNQLSLQLAVYLMAATEGGENLFGEGPQPAGMFYFRLADKQINASEKNTEDALLRQFKMSGLVLQDVDIVRAMDREIQGSSAILPAYITKDGALSAKSGSYASMEQFKKLSAYIRRTVAEIGREIMNGQVQISPCMNGKHLPCEYCRYHAVCGFRMHKNTYRIATPLKDEAVWEAISEKIQEEI